MADESGKPMIFQGEEDEQVNLRVVAIQCIVTFKIFPVDHDLLMVVSPWTCLFAYNVMSLFRLSNLRS